MAMQHASQGELIDVWPLGEALGNSKSITLMRTDHLEVVRLVLPSGKKFPSTARLAKLPCNVWKER
ncbi:protein of unknown function [Burkholderia multivorans]